MIGALTGRKLRLWLAIMGLVITGLMAMLAARENPIFDRARDAVHDLLLQAQPRPYDPDSHVHVIDIDEASLAAYGQWPWPRSYLAVLTEKLYRHGAVAVGYDVLFVEPDRTAAGPPAPIRDAGPALPRPGLPPDGQDRRFAEALRLGPSVLGLAGAPNGPAPDAIAGVSFTGSPPGDALTRYAGSLPNRALLTEAASGLGIISLGSRDDGIIRSIPAVSTVGGTLMPALSVEMLRVAQGAGGYVLRTTEASGEGSGGQVQAVALRVGAVELPLEGDGQFRIYYAGARPERLTPAAEVLATEGFDPDLAARVEGRIVLVGSSAQGLFDIRTTPLDRAVPGVIIHAEIIEQIAAGQFLVRPDWALGLEMLAIALSGLLITLALIVERPVLAMATASVLVALAIAGMAWAFSRHGLLLNPVFPILTTLAVFLPGAGFGMLAKERARAAVRARFSYFLPPALVDQIADDPKRRLTPDGAERELTVMFVDIRGFTGLTETMPPADTVRFVNRFLGAVSDALVASGATIDKFMGDAVMAFWNAPLASPDHRQDALAAILNLHSAIDRLNASAPTEALPAIDISIGINTGPASVGLMGSSDRLSYTCVGDSVTLAARLEGLTRVYGLGNCVAAETVTDLPNGMISVEIDRVAVKGRHAALPVHTVARATPEDRAACFAITDAREAYLDRDWDSAQSAFEAVRDLTLDGRGLTLLADVYLDRIAAHRRTDPAPEWDGSARLLQKR